MLEHTNHKTQMKEYKLECSVSASIFKNQISLRGYTGWYIPSYTYKLLPRYHTVFLPKARQEVPVAANEDWVLTFLLTPHTEPPNKWRTTIPTQPPPVTAASAAGKCQGILFLRWASLGKESCFRCHECWPTADISNHMVPFQ